MLISDPSNVIEACARRAYGFIMSGNTTFVTQNNDLVYKICAAIRDLKPTEKSMSDTTASSPMPRYLCHKQVWALKIRAIIHDGQGENRETDGSAMIHPEEKGYAPFRVDHAYMHKHKPEVGGYYVVYDDGYKSFSPAKAFEDGYTLISKL